MSTRIPFQWNTANFKWDAINPTDGKTYSPNEIVTGTNRWDDCALIIDGKFSCSDNNLLSLENSPLKVTDAFYCNYNGNIS